jgi:hypothetical protein
MNYYTVTYKDAEGKIINWTVQAPNSAKARQFAANFAQEVLHVVPAASLERRLTTYVENLEEYTTTTADEEEMLTNIIKDLKVLLGENP